MRFYVLILLFTTSFASMAVVGQDLHNAVKEKKLRQVKSILKENPTDVNNTDEAGRTALHLACESSSHKIIAHLVKAGANVNALDNNSLAPLHILAQLDNTTSSKLLIAQGAALEIKGQHEQTPLHYASRNGNKRVAELLIESGANKEAVTAFGRTPFLLMARESGDYNLASYLVSVGVDINAKDRFDDSALTLSAWRGFNKTNELIIENGALLPTETRKLKWTMQNAVERRLDALFDLMVKNDFDLKLELGGNTTLMHYAASGGSVNIIKKLLDEGLDVNKKDRNLWTPLHYAVEKGREDVIELLLENGADLNARTYLGETPYNVAQAYKYDEGNPIGLLKRKSTDLSEAEFPKLSGLWLGQAKAPSTPQMFAPGITTGHYSLHSTPVFSPAGNEALWAIQIPARDSGYGTVSVFYSKMENGYWTKPTYAPFEGSRVADVPFFHPNGKQLFYILEEPLKNGPGEKENIWTVEKKDGAWVNPRPLSSAVNSMNLHWQFSLDKNGGLYFGDNYSAFENDVYQKPVKIKELFKNSSLDIDMPFISKEGDYLIYTSFTENGADLFISFQKRDGSFTDGISLGESINTRANEICPIVSSDGQTFFFTRNNYPYWVDASFIEELRPKI